MIRRIACSPPGFLRILKKNKIKALKLKIIKNVPIHPEMDKNIFLCVRRGGGYHVMQNHSVFNCQCSFEPFPKMLIRPPRCAETEWASAVWLAPKYDRI